MSLAFAPDGQTLIAATLDGRINLYDLQTLANRRTLSGCWAALHPDGAENYGPPVPGWNTAFADGHVEWVVPKNMPTGNAGLDSNICQFWNGWAASFW